MHDYDEIQRANFKPQTDLRTGSHNDMEDIKLSAYILSRPNDIITHESNGCNLLDDYWLIQCSSFASTWKAGETLRISIELDNGQILENEVALTYAPFDQASNMSQVSAAPAIPVEFKLNNNYPNPFNPQTTVPYEIPKASHVKMTVYNAMGQEIKSLVDAYQNAGYYEVIWDARDNLNNLVSSGMYVIRMQAGSYIRNQKITLMK